MPWPRSMRCPRRSAIRWSSRAAAACLLLLLVAAVASARGRGADGKFEKRESSHFVLLQDVDIDETGGLRGSRRFEQDVLASLETGYDQLDQLLGLRPTRKIEVVVYDPQVFDQQFAGRFRFPAAGFYHGIIRVRGDDRFTLQLSRVLHHELVHAAFDAATPSQVYPGWFSEGMAEWFEARTHGKPRLDGWEYGALARARNAGELYSLASLSSPSFVRMSHAGARLAYLQSYAFIDYLVRRHGERALRDFSRELVRTGNFDRSLRKTFGDALAGLEAGFFDELG
jgi:hypothetical protein